MQFARFLQEFGAQKGLVELVRVFAVHAIQRQSGEPGQHFWIRYPNGDGFLLYPGKPIGHEGPVSSIRLEQAREGVEDYEYLVMLRARVAGQGEDTVAMTRAKALLDTTCDRVLAGDDRVAAAVDHQIAFLDLPGYPAPQGTFYEDWRVNPIVAVVRPEPV